MIFNSKIVATSKERVIGLDILRSIAILLVMYEHGNSLLPPKILKYITLPRPSIDGVAIFFVLSGFLIGGILLKIINTTEFTIKDLFNFWIRRWLRTIPNYYFILFILLLCQLFIAKDLGHINFKYFIFSQNLYQAHPLFFPEAWSLSIEEWFYLTFPVLTYFLFKIIKDRNRSVLIAALFFLIIPLVLRIVKFYYFTGIPNWDLNFRKIIVLRLDSLMYGIIGAYILTLKIEFWNKMKRTGLLISALLVLFLLIYSGLNIQKQAFECIYHYNLESIAVLFALPYFSELKTIKLKKLAFLFTFISLISYSMYLINLTLIRDIAIPSINNLIGWHYGTNFFLNLTSHLFQFFLFWFLTIFFSYYLYLFIELPFMNLRNRLKFKIKQNKFN